MASITRDELVAKATAMGVEIADDATKAQIMEALKEATPSSTPEPTPVVPVMSEGAQIADAIVKGLAAVKEEKKIKITSDPSVKCLFSVVKNKQGEVMLRENSTGVLSRVQLESLEEKESSIQGQEVGEV